MAFLAVDIISGERIYSKKPYKDFNYIGCWSCNGTVINLPSGSIRKLIGRELTWEDDPVELKDE